MKKFSFGLETVLDYKNQILDALMGEHAAILAEIAAQEMKIERLNEEYQRYCADYNQKKIGGITSVEANMYMDYFTKLEAVIKREHEILRSIKIRERRKREEVVRAKTETSSIEKLKERRLEEYNKEVAKSEELFIEEFVANSRISAVEN